MGERGEGGEGWGMAEKEEAEAGILRELIFSRLPVSLSTGSPAAVPGVLSLKGEWGAQGEGRPPRGFEPRRGRTGLRSAGTRCVRGPHLHLQPGATWRLGDCLLFLLNRVCRYVSHVNMGVVLISETRSFACGTEA